MLASVVILSCAAAAGVAFCVAVVPLLSLAVGCAALLVVSVLFVAEVLTVLLAELLTVSGIAGVCRRIVAERSDSHHHHGAVDSGAGGSDGDSRNDHAKGV